MNLFLTPPLTATPSAAQPGAATATGSSEDTFATLLGQLQGEAGTSSEQSNEETPSEPAPTAGTSEQSATRPVWASSPLLATAAPATSVAAASTDGASSAEPSTIVPVVEEAPATPPHSNEPGTGTPHITPASEKTPTVIPAPPAETVLAPEKTPKPVLFLLVAQIPTTEGDLKASAPLGEEMPKRQLPDLVKETAGNAPVAGQPTTPKNTRPPSAVPQSSTPTFPLVGGQQTTTAAPSVMSGAAPVAAPPAVAQQEPGATVPVAVSPRFDAAPAEAQPSTLNSQTVAVQQAPVPTPTPATAAVAPPSGPAPAHTPLNTQLAKPVMSMVQSGAGEKVITLSVTPDSLGTVTVRAHIGTDGIRIEMFAATDSGREALKTVLPDLRRDLAGAGIGSSLDLSDKDQPERSPAREQFARQENQHRDYDPTTPVQQQTQNQRMYNDGPRLDVLA